MNSEGFLVVLSGPSGAGKNTLLNAVMNRVPGLRYSVSATTRPPRPGERDGVDYFFVSDAAFDEMIGRGELLEYATFCEHRYGTPRRFVDERLAAGDTVITDIDIQGARQIQKAMPEAVFVFLMPPSMETLRQRLVQTRGRRKKRRSEAVWPRRLTRCRLFAIITTGSSTMTSSRRPGGWKR